MAKKEGSWNTVEINPQNPIFQIILIAVGGWLMGVFIAGFLRWLAWLGGGGVWIYFTFFADRQEGVKMWTESDEMKKDNRKWVLRR